MRKFLLSTHTVCANSLLFAHICANILLFAHMYVQIATFKKNSKFKISKNQK